MPDSSSAGAQCLAHRRGQAGELLRPAPGRRGVPGQHRGEAGAVRDRHRALPGGSRGHEPGVRLVLAPKPPPGAARGADLGADPGADLEADPGAGLEPIRNSTAVRAPAPRSHAQPPAATPQPPVRTPSASAPSPAAPKPPPRQPTRAARPAPIPSRRPHRRRRTVTDPNNWTRVRRYPASPGEATPRRSPAEAPARPRGARLRDRRRGRDRADPRLGWGRQQSTNTSASPNTRSRRGDRHDETNPRPTATTTSSN